MSNEAHLQPETGRQVQLATSGINTWTPDSCGYLAVDVGPQHPNSDGDNSPMRINLVTPFAEKDEVKALGARWDGTKKVWYITDVSDLTPFMRWIPNLETASEASFGAAKAPAKTSPGVITKSTVAVPHCGCQVLPWVTCEHSA